MISGGSAEMFWRGAFPGYGFKEDKDSSMNAQALSDLEDEIQDYMHDLRRYIRLRGISVETLQTQVSDPSKHIQVQIDLISGYRRYLSHRTQQSWVINSLSRYHCATQSILITGPISFETHRPRRIERLFLPSLFEYRIETDFFWSNLTISFVTSPTTISHFKPIALPSRVFISPI